MIYFLMIGLFCQIVHFAAEQQTLWKAEVKNAGCRKSKSGLTSRVGGPMGGTNPYIPTPKSEKPEKKYKIIFEGEKTVEVDPNATYHGTGLPLSILDIALASGVEIDHACGGVVACSTCHIYVKKGLSTCSEATENELDMLELAPDLKPNSRLSCQCIPNGKEDVVVEIPSWNRNLVREGK